MNAQKTCSECNTVFTCGSSETGVCWCYEYPPVFKPEAILTCMCPVCLGKAVLLKLQSHGKYSTNDHVSDDPIKKLSESNVPLEHMDYYMEKEMYVFTGWYHLKRGFCCQNGCRHCPYT